MCDMPGGENAFNAILLRLALHLLAAVISLIRLAGSRDRHAIHFIVLCTNHISSDRQTVRGRETFPTNNSKIFLCSTYCTSAGLSKTGRQRVFCLPCWVPRLRSPTQNKASEAFCDSDMADQLAWVKSWAAATTKVLLELEEAHDMGEVVESESCSCSKDLPRFLVNLSGGEE
jgi:hypothetical protein